MIRIIKQYILPTIFLIPILSFVACAERGPEIVRGVSIELARYRAATISDLDYDLSFSIPEDPEAEVAGFVSISFELSDTRAPLQLDFREDAGNVSSVIVNDSKSNYGFENEHIVIPVHETVIGHNQIEIEFIAGSTSLNRNPEFLYTLFVPDRARTAFPLFDQPDLKATYDLTLVVPAGWTAMSNASVQSVVEEGVRTEFRFATSDLISSYLFSFVAGKFETVEREVRGRSMVMLHRETDEEKVARNIEDIFDLHAAALDWLEDYTDIDYPYQKFSFALIPAFQYGGMEHVGAIQYRADGLFLDESPSDTRLLGRAGLIAHETAHMWFGDLVTMEWFNDVWTKEVFANFMADKIVNPGFPDINHELNFLIQHYPSAYSVDRTAGANPIRQYLPNLNEAGQMYGAIIYNKAPIMMRQLELMIGEDLFREGMREYLARYAFGNATWPALVEILDGKSSDDLKAWSDVWVNTAGRPEFAGGLEIDSGRLQISQIDPGGAGRVWPQKFGVTGVAENGDIARFRVSSVAADTVFDNPGIHPDSGLIFNADGLGYGIFPVEPDILDHWDQLNDVEKGAVLVNLYEVLLERDLVGGSDYFIALNDIVTDEKNQLLLDLALGQIRRLYWTVLPEKIRIERAPLLEVALWQTMALQSERSNKKIFFDAFADIATSPDAVEKVYDVWSGSRVIEDLPISENDRIELSQDLAIKMPGDAEKIIAAQLATTLNPDNQRMLRFLAPSLSPDEATRNQFFASLSDEKNRVVESWVLDALENIHHPLRTEESEQYILPSLELLQEIQTTGDIFFPKRWLDTTLGNYRSVTAAHTVRTFLDERPDFNEQLKMKILQSADMMFRASTLISADEAR
ncbi:MAG: M1 family aminopeptidase [Proteobacteria bacterium]|nr:M1 family aminopeptidase [Pseudomonadota bacterium]MDA0992962.1 M1 family aminopeptidase [Pseudomonadota bacterium]